MKQIVAEILIVLNYYLIIFLNLCTFISAFLVYIIIQGVITLENLFSESHELHEIKTELFGVESSDNQMIIIGKMVGKEFVYSLVENTIEPKQLDKETRTLIKQLSKSHHVEAKNTSDVFDVMLLLSIFDFHYLVRYTKYGVSEKISVCRENSYNSVLAYIVLRIMFCLFPNQMILPFLRNVSNRTVLVGSALNFVWSLQDIYAYYKNQQTKNLTMTINEMVQLLLSKATKNEIDQLTLMLTEEQYLIKLYLDKKTIIPKKEKASLAQIMNFCLRLNLTRNQILAVKYLLQMNTRTEEKWIKNHMQIIHERILIKNKKDTLRRRVTIQEYYQAVIKLGCIFLNIKLFKRMWLLDLLLFLYLYNYNITKKEIARCCTFLLFLGIVIRWLVVP
jgi:hypothetical protein